MLELELQADVTKSVGPFEKWLSHEDFALVNGIKPL